MKLLTRLLFTFTLLALSTVSFAAKKETCEIPPLMRELAKDLASNSALENEFKKSSPDKVKGLGEAWAILNKAGATQKKKTAVELLNGINTHFSKEPFKGNTQLQNAYIKAVKDYKGKISTSPNTGSNNLPDKAEKYFNELFEYTQKFHDKNGFNLSDAGSDINSQDGFYFAIRYMNDKLTGANVTKIDMKFENEGGNCPGCRFDAQTGSSINTVQYEFKSYKDASKIPLGQFKSYVENATNTNSFKYVFNKEKITLEKARNQMANFMNSNKTDIWNSMSDDLKDSLGLDIEGSSDELSTTIIDQMVNTYVEVY